MEQSRLDALSATSKILRTFSPQVLAAVMTISNEQKKTQEKMATQIGCARSTFSKYIQTVRDLPEPVLEKHGHQFEITDIGHEILECYTETLVNFNPDLTDSDWSSAEYRENVGEALDPLYQFRSESPFLVLVAISDSSTNTETAWIDDVLYQLDKLEEESDVVVSRQHFNQVLENYSESGAIEREEDSIRITEKGRAQITLLERISEIFRKRAEQPELDPRERTTSQPQAGQRPIPEQASYQLTSKNEDSEIEEPGAMITQDDANAFLGGSQVGEQRRDAEIGPAVFLERNGSLDLLGIVRGGSPTEVSEQFRDIANQIEQLGATEDQTVRLYRSLLTGDEVHPVGNEWQPLETASVDEWKKVNRALQLTDR